MSKCTEQGDVLSFLINRFIAARRYSSRQKATAGSLVPETKLTFILFAGHFYPENFPFVKPTILQNGIT